VERTGDVRIGISGWTYPPWRGVFYPKKLPQREELAFAARQFRTIEINGTFYGLQRPESFAAWADAVPDDFVFSVKAPRFITHIRRLREAEAPVANFLASGILRLGVKLGPILWQFPPTLRFDPERFAPFLAMLPHDTETAASFAGRHDAWLNGRDWTKTDAARKLRHAVEVRHESFRSTEFIDQLRANDVALACADTPMWPRLGDLTSDFVYCRLHGVEELYATGYDDETLDAWGDRVAAWACGGEATGLDRVGGKDERMPRDAFLYFDNDLKVRAPHDAGELVQRVAQRLQRRCPHPG
jgi:uncharacterized protein YecE (DUF72 family)